MNERRYADGTTIPPYIDPLAVGDPGDEDPVQHQLLDIVSILKDAGIPCCFVQHLALRYYGGDREAVRGHSRGPNDRVLCVPDEDHMRAIDIFLSHSAVLKPCEPSPVITRYELTHIYPRFKAVGRTDFWSLVPANYCHVDCIPENIEWSRGGLPYLKLPVYVQSLLDTKESRDLEHLVDGMDLSVEWGEKYLDLEGVTDTEWLGKLRKALRDDGTPDLFNFVDPKPESRRETWENCVRDKPDRMGSNHPTETYATRYRRHGSKDPRVFFIDGL